MKNKKDIRKEIGKGFKGSFVDVRRYLDKHHASVLGVIVSDLHLRHTSPKARAEKSWYNAMLRPLNEIRTVAEQFNCPLFYPGDIFHTYNEPAELINFAIENLPKGYAIPGQHDLPLHNYDDMSKSAYYTLVKAGILLDLKPGQPYRFKASFKHHSGVDCFVTGFPWQSTLQMNEDKDNFHFAMAHRYVWIGAHSFRGASDDDKITQLSDFISSYDAVAFGDNHKGFTWRNAMNCGSLMRHNIDQTDYEPQIGILLDNGVILPYKLKYIAKDKWSSITHVATDGQIANLKYLSQTYKELAAEIVDFGELLELSIKQSKLTKAQRRILLTEISKIKRRGE